MEKKFKRLEIYGFIFVAVLGTLFHFVYEWSGNVALVGFVAPVNEGVWEHTKMLFFPFLFWAVMEYFVSGKKFSAFIYAKTIAVITGIVFLISFYYTYTGAFGIESLIIDVISFIFAVALSFLISYRLTARIPFIKKWVNAVCLAFVIILIACYIAWSINPPHIPLFQNPNTGLFGM